MSNHNETFSQMSDRKPVGQWTNLPEHGLRARRWPLTGNGKTIRLALDEATDADFTAEVMEDLQRAMKGTRDARTACVNPTHDHDTYLLVTGEQVGEPVAMMCYRVF